MASSNFCTSDSRKRAESLLEQMTLDEKIGQLVQVNGEGGHLSDEFRHRIADGRIGSVINEVDPAVLTEMQRTAREESRHGIPLLIGRDVIHGFKTILPIPLGLAATWNDSLVAEGAEISALEASQQGVNWTFSPMLDVSRDPRWGRIAESFGEDPLLTSRMGTAMVAGYQNQSEYRLMSCLKHFVGYGASESGRDYNTTSIPDVELRNVYLPPFLAGVKAGALSVMPSFSDLNGMPPSGNGWLLRDILRREWGFRGFVVSDWESITQLTVHGVAEDARAAALKAADAGVNMDMASGAFETHLEELIESGAIEAVLVDELVCEILAAKFHTGLFDQPLRDYFHAPRQDKADEIAKQLAIESTVMLKNDGDLLPVRDDESKRICLIGPLADQPYEQLGTWVFDGDVERSISLRQALEGRIGERLSFCPGLWTSRDHGTEMFEEALGAAMNSDVVVLALGEEAILSGEAHCRADITLPGAQAALVEYLRQAGKPVVAIIMAGRPLVLAPVLANIDAILFAWHPGSMAGPALVELLFGDVSPSGKLPVTMPRSAGQIPIYYAHGNTGKPATPETIVSIDDIDAKAPQLSVGNTSFHLDVHPSPQYPFGFGLSYTSFEYSNLRVEKTMQNVDDMLEISVDLTNVGSRQGSEVVQLYIQDVVASITRPVRELKGYERVQLEAGETRAVNFSLSRDQLSFFNGRETVIEPGLIRIWAGGSAAAELVVETEVLAA